MKIFKLNKKVISVKNNFARLLNGITTNSLDATKNSFVDITGRIIATFDQLKISDFEMLLIFDILSKKNIASAISEEEFTLFRLENNIPLQGIDYDREMLLNLGEEYVSLQKAAF